MVGGPSVVGCVLLLIRYMLNYLAYPEASPEDVSCRGKSKDVNFLRLPMML